MIINKTTAIKRRIKLILNRIFAKFHNFRIKSRAKKIISKLRKKYIKTGEYEFKFNKFNFKFDVTEPLEYLKTLNLIAYEKEEQYYTIIIKE